jgi:hypothetical protein
MVREIGKNYYQTTHFRFEGNLNLLSKFRATDQWKLGFLPVSFVLCVEVSIQCKGDEFERIQEIEEIEEEAGHGWEVPAVPSWADGGRSVISSVERTTLFKSDLLMELETLFSFRAGTTITIRITLATYKKPKLFERLEFMCENVVPVIFPFLQRLRDTGLRVRFVLVTVHNSWKYDPSMWAGKPCVPACQQCSPPQKSQPQLWGVENLGIETSTLELRLFVNKFLLG